MRAAVTARKRSFQFRRKPKPGKTNCMSSCSRCRKRAACRVGKPVSRSIATPSSRHSPNKAAKSRRTWPCLSARSALRSHSKRRTLSSEATVAKPARSLRDSTVTERCSCSPATAPKPNLPNKRRRRGPRACSSVCKSLALRGRTSSADNREASTTDLNTRNLRGKGTWLRLKN